jgi:hypothetical protein
MVAAASVLPASAATFVQPRHSDPGPGEVDTAARRGGQAGGIGLGLDYDLPTLRCGAGEAIVGAQIRRGDVLDYLQIACARPTCTPAGCQWAGSRAGPAAGNPSGGDPHRAMVCAANAAVASFRARVVAFTRFDYTADLEIECARLTSGPDARGFFRVAREAGDWLHPEGGLGRGYVPPNVTRNTTTAPITCRPNGAVSAFSLGVATSFVRPQQRVVQAVSLYCPGTAPDPSCPDTLAVVSTADQRPLIDAQWFARGGRTGGGIVAVMEARPANRSWQGARISETLSLDVNSCNIRNAQNLCTTGNAPDFVVGVPAGTRDLPIGVRVTWSPQGAPAQNSFPDFHFVADGAGRPAGVSLLGTGTGPCVVSCRQSYTCGRGTQQVSYGPFAITYTFTRDRFQPSGFGILRGPAVDVTRASVTKR